MPRACRLYLSVVDPEDNGQRTVGSAGDPDELTYSIPIEARDRLTEPCPRCDKEHDALWLIKRKMIETFGHFPVFMINGSKVIVDASLPTGVIKLPRDARRLSPDRAAALWHDTSDLHVFGASDPAPVHEW